MFSFSCVANLYDYVLCFKNFKTIKLPAGLLSDPFVRQTLSQRKIMVSVFWDSHGVLQVDFMQRGITINAETYWQSLRQLGGSIQSNRHCMLTKKIVLFYDKEKNRKKTCFQWKISWLRPLLVFKPMDFLCCSSQGSLDFLYTVFCQGGSSGLFSDYGTCSSSLGCSYRSNHDL